MYSAYGRDTKRLPNGDVYVKVEILRDDDQSTVKFQEFIAPDRAGIRQQVKDALQILIASERDAALSAAFVGVLIANV
jgi:hypothetical protein